MRVLSGPSMKADLRNWSLGRHLLEPRELCIQVVHVEGAVIDHTALVGRELSSSLPVAEIQSETTLRERHQC